MRQTMRQDEMEDMVALVSQTFLGMTTHCARCHDHKFDPISSRDYYRMAASLAGVEFGERVLPSGSEGSPGEKSLGSDSDSTGADPCAASRGSAAET